MATTDTPLINQSPQNTFLQGIADTAAAIGNLGNTAAGIYSTFIGAKTTAQLAKAQGSNFAYQPTQAQLDAIEGSRMKQTNFLIYAGVGVAVIGTLALIYKAVK